MTFGSSFWKKGSLYLHTLMYFHGTWAQWSMSRVTLCDLNRLGVKSSSWGQWPLVQVYEKRVSTVYPHTYMFFFFFFRSNITMIAKVCDCESRRDSWFENRLVCTIKFWVREGQQFWLAILGGKSLLIWACMGNTWTCISCDLWVKGEYHQF